MTTLAEAVKLITDSAPGSTVTKKTKPKKEDDADVRGSDDGDNRRGKLGKHKSAKPERINGKPSLWQQFLDADD